MWDFKAAFPMLANLNSRQHSLQYAACLTIVTILYMRCLKPNQNWKHINFILPPPGILINIYEFSSRNSRQQEIQDGFQLTTWWSHWSQNTMPAWQNFTQHAKEQAGDRLRRFFHKICSRFWELHLNCFKIILIISHTNKNSRSFYHF